MSERHQTTVTQLRIEETGVTAIELLVTVAIAAVLAALAVPSFTDYIARTRLTSMMWLLLGDLNTARAEAIKRNARVLVCARATGGTCTTGTNWSNGWIVCFDMDSNGTCDANTATNPNPIRMQSALTPALLLTGPATAVRFNATGSANAAATFSMSTGADGSPTRIGRVAATGDVSGNTSSY